MMMTSTWLHICVVTNKLLAIAITTDQRCKDMFRHNLYHLQFIENIENLRYINRQTQSN